MTVIICPGVHSPELTESFLWGLGGQIADYLIFPSETTPPYSALHILEFLHRQFSIPRSPTSRPASQHQPTVAAEPLLFIGFSAGVVGAIGAAWMWQGMGRTVKALIALDGWGVPLYGNFPIHRLSHDRFTHWSSARWGEGQDNFYADPPVPHLDLWRSPQTATGWRISPDQPKHQNDEATPTTAAEFLLMLLGEYGELRGAIGLV
jgi:hypothetical protein